MRQVNLREDVIWKFRVNELCDRELFVSVDRDEDALRETMKPDFGLDPQQGFAYKRELRSSPRLWRPNHNVGARLGVSGGFIQNQV